MEEKERDSTLDVSGRKYHQPSRRRKRWLLAVSIVLLILVASGITSYSWMTKNRMPLPNTILQILNFQAYYPNKLPKGFKYKQGSAFTSSGLLYYRINNGTKYLSVTEQQAPSQPVSTQSIPGITPVTVPNGKAYTGTSAASPSGLLITNSAIVSITTTGGSTKSDVIVVLQHLQPVQ